MRSPRLFAGLAALAFLAGLTLAGTLVLWPSPRSALPPVPAQPTQAAAPHPPAEPPAPSVEASTALVVLCDPVGASVYADGRLLGQAPLRARSLLPDTDYELVIDKPRFLPSTVKVRLERGKEKQISVTLKKKSTR